MDPKLNTGSPLSKYLYKASSDFLGKKTSSALSKVAGPGGKAMGAVSGAMSLYDLTNLGSKDIAGQTSSVLGALSLIPGPQQVPLMILSSISGMFGGQARHGLRG